MDTAERTSLSLDQPSTAVLQQFDWTTSESVSSAIVRAVAAVSDTAPTELPTLYEDIDPDALDTLVSEDRHSPARGNIDITFTFHDFLVLVASTGEGYIYPGDAE